MLEVGEKWGSYVLIRTQNKKLFWHSDVEKAYNKHKSSYSKVNLNNVWYDLKEKRCFSGAQIRNSSAGKDHHFNDHEDTFISGRWGKSFVRNVLGLSDKGEILENKKIVFDSEIVMNHMERFEDYRGKTLLLICGGPSVDDVRWENLNYDYVWSCNDFFKNDRVKSEKIDLITLATNVQLLGNEELEKYITENDTIVSFEIERGHLQAERRHYDDMFDFIWKYHKNSCFFQTRYRSQPGVGLRMLCYAGILGFDKIYVVGLDGRTELEEDGKLLHAFDGDKPVPNWYRRFGHRFQERQFVVFWDYVERLKQKYNFSVYNLGEGKHYNASTFITRTLCPLSNKIKEKIEAVK